MSDYVVHPAFNYGGTKLAGIWVGKYETSSKEGNSNSTNGDNVTSKTVQIKAGVSSWRYIQVSNIFTVCTEMNKSSNPYKLNTSDTVVDPHMMKNSEWGAVAYLSKSKYGKELEEVWKNNSSSYITGSAGNSASADKDTGTTNDYKSCQGQKASTTGNTTGVYDMNGGAWEYVAAYVNNVNSNLETYGSTLINAASKYRDVYSIGNSDETNDYKSCQGQKASTTGNTTGVYDMNGGAWEYVAAYVNNVNSNLETYGSTLINAASKYRDVYSIGNSDDRELNYQMSTPDRGYYGDAIWETSSRRTDASLQDSWYRDYSYFPYYSGPFFRRGGIWGNTTGDGIFAFADNDGYSYSVYGFRVVVPVF